MDERPELNTGKLVWSGEHWINAIRPEGDEEPSAWFSLFHTRYSEVGEGNALQLVVPEVGLEMICADNMRVGQWVKEKFFARSSVRTPDAPVVQAEFSREGATHSHPSWVVEVDSHRVAARWTVTEPPTIAYGPFREGVEFFTILFFTMESTVEVDGRQIEGKPYLRDIWKPTIGGDRSSSVFALSESLIETG